MKKILILILTMFGLTACAGQILQDGKQDFDQGHYSDAMQKLMPLAEKDNPAAQYAVGYMYYYGQGVPVNRALGLIWIDKAAAQGLPEAVQAQAVLHKQAKLNPLAK